jgi:hypothetical protein
MKNEQILSNINDFLNGNLKNTRYSYSSKEAIDNYIERFSFGKIKENFIELEIAPNEFRTNAIKISLLNNIEYDLIGIDMDGDVSILRLFTLQEKKETRYFSSTGSEYVFGYPTEHSKEDFIKLFDNHPGLKDIDFIKYLTVTNLHSELQEDLSTQDNKNKKLKI